MGTAEEALRYHEEPTPGKLAICPTKPCETARDLALAYSPGVAEPCLAIEKNSADAYRYTSKGNLVAVISNGTAVLGLGDIGAAAAKPVMEGKAILFKTFADIDVFDLEIDCKDPAKFIDTVAALAPTFGGINLEDIKAPECFEIESALCARLSIPVFHDDQHGTAIIAAAALLNALQLTQRTVSSSRLVINGAGAAAIASARLLITLGFNRNNITMCDTQGVIYQGREKGMNKYKAEFAAVTAARTLADALSGADIFFGLSSKDVMTPEMLTSMARDPIVFAMANPDPEIDYHAARATRPDAIIATGRSDFPNQVNNVLGFPYLFRGALDVRATVINEEMKLAAVHALAALAKEPVPDSVCRAYGRTNFSFGRDYLIPKPFDPRVLYHVSPAVAHAAMVSGAAQQKIDIVQYTRRLKAKQNQGRAMLEVYHDHARHSKTKRIALPQAANEKVIKAAFMAKEEGIAEPILLGRAARIEQTARALGLSLEGITVIEPEKDSRFERYIENYFRLQNRNGITISEARRDLARPTIFANMMVASGDADGLICGVDRHFPAMVKPILDLVGLKPGVRRAAGMYLVSIQNKLFFMADTAINITLDSEQLASIAIMAAEFAQSMNITPRIAMLSYSNFGSVKHPTAVMVRRAKEIVEERAPQLQVDGEMQADTAVVAEILSENHAFCKLDGPANVLIFPDMQSGNIAYKLLQRLGGARVIGPVILGVKAPAYVMQRHAGVEEIFNMITVAVAQATMQSRQRLSMVHGRDATRVSNW